MLEGRKSDSLGGKENACFRSFWGIKPHLEKDIQWNLRKVESNGEYVTSAGQTDGHKNSIIRDFQYLHRSVFWHLIAVSSSRHVGWLKLTGYYYSYS